MHHIRLPLLLLALLSALAFAPGAARPSSTATELNGSVGPGFRITLTDANGITVSHLDPGAYHITIQNLSDPNTGVVHNFHLKGPGGINLATTSDAGTTSWDVTFVDGIYTYLCDFHPLQMRNTFTAGTTSAAAEADEAEGDRRSAELDLAQEGQQPRQVGQGRKVHHQRHRRDREGQLPPEGAGRLEEDERCEAEQGDLEAHAAQGEVHVLLRRSQDAEAQLQREVISRGRRGRRGRSGPSPCPRGRA